MHLIRLQLIGPTMLAVCTAWVVIGPFAYGDNIEAVDILIRHGQYAEAVAEIDKESVARPDNLDLILRKGICQSMLFCFAESRVTFEQGLAIDPKDPRFLHNLGLLCMREKKFSEAEEWFKKTLAIRPWHPEANFHLGVIYEGRGDVKTAMEYYTRELNHNARCAKAWQRWHVLKSAAQGRQGRISLSLVLLAACATAAGLFVLFRQKKLDEEEIECAS
ncbi:MAG: tetratricopeptide repeat protein [Planctomycetota bacterium]